jgi:hypothetical protein
MNTTARRFIHDTEDGLIVSETTRQGRGKWLAHHWGPQLDGARNTKTLKDGMTYLIESFQQMFPEHQCTERCELLDPHSDRANRIGLAIPPGA